MNFKIRFEGSRENVNQAIDAMKDFNSFMPVPKEIEIYKMVPVSEDYFYFLLSEKGIVSKEQGEKSLKRFEKETQHINCHVVFCYKEFARNMVDNYEKYEACTIEAWKHIHWGVSEQPNVTRLSDSEIIISGVLSMLQGVINAVCQKYTVRAKIKE